MEFSSISFSEPKYAIKMYDLPIFKGLGAKLGLGKEIRAPRRVGKKIRVPATLYTCVPDWEQQLIFQALLQ